MKKGFTLVELVIVIAIIAIISALLIPKLTQGYDNSKENIIDIYNGSTIRIIDIDTNEILYEGTESNLTGYTLVNVEYKDGVIVMYVKIKK